MFQALLIVAAIGAEPLSPAGSVALGAGDIQKLSPFDAKFQRYIWVHLPAKQSVGAVNYVLNTVQSHSNSVVRAWPVVPDTLLRIDLRALAPREKDLARLISVWESMAEQDPYFHIRQESEEIVAVPPYVHTDGKTYRGKRVKKVKSEFAIHTGLQNMLLLATMTQSNMPIVRADWLMVKSLTTLNGGLYYDFRGIRGLNQKEWLARAGANEKQISEEFNSDDRSAMFRSNVTGKPRRIDLFYGTGTRPTVGTPLISITHDITDADNDAAADPLQNVVEFRDAAREAFRTLPSGFIEFALFNAKGELQDAVPDNVAKDHTIPAPYTAVLQSGISCLRCHGPSEDMWQPFVNDLQGLLRGRLKVIGDLTLKGGHQDFIEKVNKYQGEALLPLQQARNGHAHVTFLATGGMKIPEVTGKIAEMYRLYEYTMVTPEMACAELGIVVPDGGDAVAAFNAAVPDLPGVGGLSPEGLLEGALKEGVAINRRQFERAFVDKAARRHAELVRQGKATP